MTRAPAFLLAVLCFATPAWAQDAAALSGTLKAVLDRGAIRIGYREDAVPFSFLNPGKQPVGFSLDLCHGIAQDVAAALNQDLLEPGAPAWQRGIRLAYVAVAADQRLPMVVSGAIDLECGSTTANAERARTVAFSPVFFLAGTKIMVPRGSPVRSYRALAGKTVAVSAGTTNAAVMKKAAAGLVPPMRVAEFASVDAAFLALAAGQAEAAASDDILLTGAMAAHPGQSFDIVGDYLSYEPYAIMFRRDDPDFAALVSASFGRMAVTGVLRGQYERWFTERLPTGTTLNLPMGATLAEMYRGLGQED